MDDVLGHLNQLNLGWLSQAEQHRYDSFSSGARRRQFLCGRFLVREVIGHIRGGQWDTYFLSAPEEGAPRLTGQSGDEELDTMCISISHTDGWVACAVSDRAIGVDVQSRNKQRDIIGLSQMIGFDFSPEKDSSAIRLNRLFYANWGLSEAWIKQCSVSSGASVPRFVPGHTSDNCLGGLVCDIGDATLALYPARLEAIEMAPGSVQVSHWANWRLVSE